MEIKIAETIALWVSSRTREEELGAYTCISESVPQAFQHMHQPILLQPLAIEIDMDV